MVSSKVSPQKLLHFIEQFSQERTCWIANVILQFGDRPSSNCSRMPHETARSIRYGEVGWVVRNSVEDPLCSLQGLKLFLM